ncbi:MAG: PKD domain-containing protein [Armatimonadota bacterium]
MGKEISQTMGLNRSRVPARGRRSSWIATATFLGMVAVGAGSSLAVRANQDGAPAVSFTLYRGEGNSGNVRLSSWGSGSAVPTSDNVLLGDAAIKVTTHGMFQGGRIDFKEPVDLTAALANGRTYVRLMTRFNSSSGSNVTGSFPGAPGGFGGEGGFSSTGSLANKAPFERMRFLAILSDGRQIELIRPLDMKPTDDPDAYMPITFPVAALKKATGGTLASGKLKSLVICGDKYQQFQIGEIQVITDDSEIDVAPLEQIDAFADNDIPFQGDAEGGASTLKFTWDWDAADGTQEDAVGRSVNKVFKKAGKTVVTLTVSDVDGLKKPQSVKLELDVAP